MILLGAEAAYLGLVLLLSISSVRGSSSQIDLRLIFLSKSDRRRRSARVMVAVFGDVLQPVTTVWMMVECHPDCGKMERPEGGSEKHSWMTRWCAQT